MLLWVLLGLMVLLSIGCCIFKDLLYVAVSLATISGDSGAGAVPVRRQHRRGF